jgi:hypothetical protein
LAFERVDWALEKARWVVTKLQRYLVSPLLKRLASMLELGVSKYTDLEEWLKTVKRFV